MFLPGECIRAQINWVLQRWEQTIGLGSSGVPCYLIEGKTEGEWDVNVRDFVRIFFTDRAVRARARNATLLDDAVRDRLRDTLISVSGAPLPVPSYSLLECGNQERSTGTPEELAEEQGQDSWLEGALDDFWEGLKWFFKRLLLVLAIAVAVATVGAALAALGLPAVLLAAGAALATIAVVLARIPETENHLLMIESSRYLKNQILIEYYDANQQHANRRGYEPHQRALKAWLLQKMQGVMADDFEEYNAIPYQRYSLTALLNLHDFAADPELREAARLVLDRQMAKFVVSSSEGRRFAPFRRLIEHVEDFNAQSLLSSPAYDAAKSYKWGELAFFDETHYQSQADNNQGNPPGPTSDKWQAVFGGGAVWPLSSFDFTAALAMGFFAHAEQLPDGRAHRYAAMPIMYSRVTSYRPADIIRDLARQKPDGIWFHQIGHAGVERYTRGRGFLLAAGGQTSDFANKIEVAGLSLPLGNDNDRGAACPTTLMIDGGPSRQTLADVLRINGKLVTYPDDGDKKMFTFDQNVQVWETVASGSDIRVPSSYRACLQGEGPVIGGYRWRFFTTTNCAAYINAAAVHVAIFSNATSIAPLDPNNPSALIPLGDGFIEVADANTAVVGNFDDFKAKILSRSGTLSGFPAGATYTTLTGTIVQLSLGQIQVPAPRRGIAGPILAAGRNVVEVRNPQLGRTLVLDFQDVANPKQYER